jgi:hypothetical protein
MTPARIRSRTKTVLLAGIVLFAVGFTVWPGCAFLPLPSKTTPIGSRTKAQFKMKRLQPLTRAEIVAQLGRPDDYLPDIRVACYRVNNIDRRKVILLLLIIPMGVEHYRWGDLAFIQYDAQGRVLRAAVERRSSGDYLGHSARQWHDKAEKQDPVHQQKSQIQHPTSGVSK